MPDRKLEKTSKIELCQAGRSPQRIIDMHGQGFNEAWLNSGRKGFENSLRYQGREE